MKKISLTALTIVFISALVFGQNLTQTVRGTVLDTDSKMPLIGVNITVLGSDPMIGTSTNAKGEFRFDNIPLGRITLQISYIGYENLSVPNTEVNSGKEVVLNLYMRESVREMGEVIIVANKDKGEAMNDMSLVSVRSISTDESKRYAGSFNDPARILSNFAGVASTQDGNNDIIVRGNSPKYVQWRIEGVEISNPNHFADQNAVGGGLSALNNNLLSTSDFYTGAFSPEFGDALSGVYDVNLRAGNNEKFESVFGLGILGADLTLEGAFKKGYGGSYLASYRYSTVSLVDNLGLIDIGGVPQFQDGTFKVVLPTKKIGTFSLFGMGGLSRFLFEDVTPKLWDTPGNGGMAIGITEDFKKDAYLFNTGLNHTLSINDKSSIKTSLSYSTNGINDDVFESRTIKLYDNKGEFLRDSLTDKMVNLRSRLKRSTYRGAMTYNLKLNSKSKIQIGSKYALFNYAFNNSQFQNNPAERFTSIDVNENISTLRNFISWKHRLNKNLTVVSGFHNMNVLYNNKSTLEPRIALNVALNNTSSVDVGYGNHSSMESVHNYFARVKLKDGSVIQPNKNLGLLRANHFVVGYQKRFTDNLMAKVETYYQDLYNIPVENSDTSTYSTLNEGLEFRYVPLVNKGTGKNYGIEFTVERFFNNSYYYLINGSLYNSKYKSLEGVERNTQYNGNYLINVLCGKEFADLGKKNNQTLNLNARVLYSGGRKIIPLLRDTQGNIAVDPANNKYWDYQKAYENKIEDTYQVVLSASYKWNKAKSTHEIFINLDNITDNKGKISEYYDESEPGSTGYVTQFGLFPNLMYRVYF